MALGQLRHRVGDVASIVVDVAQQRHQVDRLGGVAGRGQRALHGQPDRAVAAVAMDHQDRYANRAGRGRHKGSARAKRLQHVEHPGHRRTLAQPARQRTADAEPLFRRHGHAAPLRFIRHMRAEARQRDGEGPADRDQIPAGQRAQRNGGGPAPVHGGPPVHSVCNAQRCRALQGDGRPTRIGRRHRGPGNRSGGQAGAGHGGIGGVAGVGVSRVSAVCRPAGRAGTGAADRARPARSTPACTPAQHRPPPSARVR